MGRVGLIAAPECDSLHRLVDYWCWCSLAVVVVQLAKGGAPFDSNWADPRWAWLGHTWHWAGSCRSRTGWLVVEVGAPRLADVSGQNQFEAGFLAVAVLAVVAVLFSVVLAYPCFDNLDRSFDNRLAGHGNYFPASIGLEREAEDRLVQVDQRAAPIVNLCNHTCLADRNRLIVVVETFSLHLARTQVHLELLYKSSRI